MAEEKLDDITVLTEEISIITFKIGNKIYGIDIMNVKEICDAVDFTYIPNTSKYVRGVYNLRGEIISVIDVRVLFNIEHEQKSKEDLIVLVFDDYHLAIIVDEIQKVFQFYSQDIQPVHSVFTDINIKYIKGIVNVNNSFIIILDVLKLFAKDSSKKKLSSSVNFLDNFQDGPMNERYIVKKNETTTLATSGDSIDFDDNYDVFVNDLNKFSNFCVNKSNETWIKKAFKTNYDKTGNFLKFTSKDDVEKFLKNFYSKNSGKNFWDEDYMYKLKDLFEFDSKKQLKCWIPKCTYGSLAFSLSVFLLDVMKKNKYKIWSMDNDFYNISGCIDLEIQKKDLPKLYHQYGKIQNDIFKFDKSIKDSIIFEYHDIENLNNLPFIDIIIAKNVFSLYNGDKLEEVINIIINKLDVGGYIIIGDNEELNSPNLKPVASSVAKIYKKF